MNLSPQVVVWTLSSFIGLLYAVLNWLDDERRRRVAVLSGNASTVRTAEARLWRARFDFLVLAIMLALGIVSIFGIRVPVAWGLVLVNIMVVAGIATARHRQRGRVKADLGGGS